MSIKRPMNIALVSQEYPPETAHGGIGTQTFTKAHGLSLLGHKVFVISHSVDSKRHERREGEISVIRIPGMQNEISDMTDIVQWLTYSVMVASEIEDLHQRVSLDIVDFPEWAAEGYVYLLNRKDWKRVPVVIQLHGPLVMFGQKMKWPDINSEFYRIGTQMEATCVQLADAVYSSSKCSADWVQLYYNAGKDQIPTIHLGVDTTMFSPQQIPRHTRTTILFIGNVVQSKGIEELVEAASRLVKSFPDLCLRILGKGEEEYIHHLKQKAQQLGAPFLLEFPGFIHKDELPAELSKAHVFAAPSWYEGGPGFVYLEAMACGLPVVGCSGSGVDEIITSGKNGLLVPPKDVGALEQALRKILGDKKLSGRMGSKAREYVLLKADSNYCLKTLESFYISVVESKERKCMVAEDFKVQAI